MGVGVGGVGESGRVPAGSTSQRRSSARRRVPKAPEEMLKLEHMGGQCEAGHMLHSDGARSECGTNMVLNLEAMTTGVLAANSSVIMRSVAPTEALMPESAGNLRARPGSKRDRATQARAEAAARKCKVDTAGFCVLGSFL